MGRGGRRHPSWNILWIMWPTYLPCGVWRQSIWSRNLKGATWKKMAGISVEHIQRVNLHYQHNGKKQQCWCYACCVAEITMLDSYIHILGHPADAFVQSDLQYFTHTFTHWWWRLPCKVPTSTWGAVWGSVSCPRTLWHADQWNRTSDLLIARRWLDPEPRPAQTALSCFF